MTFYPILGRTGSSPDPTPQATTPSKVHARRHGHGRSGGHARAKTEIAKDGTFSEEENMKHETTRDRRRKTADKLEIILVKRFLAREKLDYADAVWLRRAVRQLRTDRIR